MVSGEREARRARRGLRVPSLVSRSLAPTTILWLLAALAVLAFAARFAMRALGVREDSPFPGFIYSITAPMVEPFYRFFPVSPRFDYRAFEAASLAAAGAALAVALGIYVLTLLVTNILGSRK